MSLSLLLKEKKKCFIYFPFFNLVWVLIKDRNLRVVSIPHTTPLGWSGEGGGGGLNPFRPLTLSIFR